MLDSVKKVVLRSFIFKPQDLADPFNVRGNFLFDKCRKFLSVALNLIETRQKWDFSRGLYPFPDFILNDNRRANMKHLNLAIGIQ